MPNQPQPGIITDSTDSQIATGQHSRVLINNVEVDFSALKVKVDDQWRDIEARQLRLLKLLLSFHGQAVSRDQIMNDLWQNTVVSDNSVSQVVTQLRKALNDDKDTPRFIRTVPRIGYQLIARIQFPQPDPTTPFTHPIDSPNSPATAAELTALSPSLVNKASHPFAKLKLTLLGMALGVLATLGSIELNHWHYGQPLYQYESRLTSVPGPESFLRYSPDGRYLAFSQTAQSRDHMDLVVYDANTQSIHGIKNTGYSELAPEWSPDGQYLIYYREDPLSCEIRLMTVTAPVETWRLSPDVHLADCQPGYQRQKMQWLNATTLFVVLWHDNQRMLAKLTLSDDGYPKVTDITRYPKFSPILMDLDKPSKQLLMVEKNPPWYELKLLNLNSFRSTQIARSKHDYWGLKWHQSRRSFWLGSDHLRLMRIDGDGYADGDTDIRLLSMGFIADLDLNPVTRQLAHTEGLVNVNLYSLDLSRTDRQPAKAQQLSSSARSDILPTISADGDQTVFISYQRRGLDGLKHMEVWLRHKHKEAADLLTNLPEAIQPDYLLFSPNAENVLLGDSDHNVYLINIFSKHMVPVISGFDAIDGVNWSEDGKHIFFKAQQGGQWQHWRYDLQLASSRQIEPPTPVASPFSAQMIAQLNPSYIDYSLQISTFLTQQLTDQLPVENLLPALQRYRPAIVDDGIFYVVPQGHQLGLFFYQFASHDNHLLSHIGEHLQDINVPLNVSGSKDGQWLVFSRIEQIETDILVQRLATND